MTWSYRIVRHKDGHLGLHEVYYNKAGEPWSRTEDPCSFGADKEDGPESVVTSLKMALKDAETWPVLDDLEDHEWARPDFADGDD